MQHSIMNEMSNVQQQNYLIFILSIGFVTDGEFDSLRIKGAKHPTGATDTGCSYITFFYSFN